MIPRIVKAIFENGFFDFENNSKTNIKIQRTRFIKRNLYGMRFILAKANDKNKIEPLKIPTNFWGEISLDFTSL